MNAHAGNPVLDAALAYAARGWRVFPCDPNPQKPHAKRPLVGIDRDDAGRPIDGSGWPRKASSDPEQIRAWWRRWPRALIGMAPGWADAFVVDLDPKGEAVETVEARLAAAIGAPLPTGPRTRTQSGGLHLWFRRPDRGLVGNTTPGLANIDIRCDLGYVIVPPSVMGNGNAYAWIGTPYDGEAPEVPTALMALIDARERHEVPAPSDLRAAPVVVPRAAPPPLPREAGDEARRRYARASLDRIKADVASTGAKRGTALYAGACAAGRFVAHGALSEREAIAALVDAAEINGVAKVDGLASIERDIRRGLDEGRATAAEIKPWLDEVAAKAEERARRRRRDLLHDPGRDRGSDKTSVPELELRDAGRPAASASPPSSDLPARSGDSREGRSDGGRAGREAAMPPDLVCARLPMTDLGNAERFLLRHGDDFLFVREWGWLAWDGRRWAREGAEDAIERAIQATIRCIGDEAAAVAGHADNPVVRVRRGGPVPLAEALADWGLTAQGAGHVTCLKGLIQASLARRVAEFDADPWAINVRNGTLHVARRGPDEPYVELRPHDRCALITKLAPVDYDPAATSPRFDRFLDEVQPPDDAGRRGVQRLLDQWGGLSLVGDASVQRLVFLYGKGRNGKSVWMDTVAHIAGDYAETIPIETFIDYGRARNAGAPTPELAILAGVRCLRTSEPERGVKLAESLIKLATGGEPMKVRELNKGYFTLRVQFKLTMQGNYRPKIDGVDEGIWGRLVLIPWSVYLPPARRDPSLATKLTAEASGILNRLLAGLCDVLNNGLLLPEIVEQATAEYRADSDPLGRFLAVCTRPALGKRVQSTDLHGLYIAWARVNGGPAWSLSGLGRALRDRGIPDRKSSVVYWLDLELIRSPHDFAQAATPDDRQWDDGGTGS
jgi:putative DNA primase/helicase